MENESGPNDGGSNEASTDSTNNARDLCPQKLLESQAFYREELRSSSFSGSLSRNNFLKLNFNLNLKFS